MNTQEEGRKQEFLERLQSAGLTLGRVQKIDIEQVKQLVSFHLHENWKAEYAKKNRVSEGSIEHKPRWRPLGDDQAWMERLKTDPALQKIYRNENGEHQIDIAHATYDQLSMKWQKENKNAGEFVVDHVVSRMSPDVKFDESFLESTSSDVHDAWRDRNEWVYNEVDSLQKLNYNDPRFPEYERARDREHVVLAVEALAGILH